MLRIKGSTAALRCRGGQLIIGLRGTIWREGTVPYQGGFREMSDTPDKPDGPVVLGSFKS
jgi:hypothetical protein